MAGVSPRPRVQPPILGLRVGGVGCGLGDLRRLVAGGSLHEPFRRPPLTLGVRDEPVAGRHPQRRLEAAGSEHHGLRRRGPAGTLPLPAPGEAGSPGDAHRILLDVTDPRRGSDLVGGKGAVPQP